MMHAIKTMDRALRSMMLVFVAMVLASAGVLWWVWQTAPQTYAIDLADRQIVQGVYPPEPAGVWLREDVTVQIPRTYYASWHILDMTWQRFSQADAFAVTLTQKTSAGVESGASDMVPAKEWRRVQYLLRAPYQGDTLRLQSSTQVFAGDQRAVGALVRTLSVQVLPVTTTATLAYLVSFWAVYAALAVWLWRGRWLGALVWTMAVALLMTVLWQELQTGFYQPYIVMTTQWRWGFAGALLGLSAWRIWRPTAIVPESQQHGRRFGLDVIRFLAVLCVVIAHAVPLLPDAWSSNKNVFPWFVYLGGSGVDMFFSLSGYLIGRIILRLMDNIHRFEVVQRFWMRRWLRTLPAAYVSALVIWIFAPPNDFFAYLQSILFLGTIDPHYIIGDMSFWWSLGAEEVFYFLFPLLVYTLCRRLKLTSMQAFVTSVALFLIIPTIVRFVLQQILDLETAGDVLFTIYARLDSMVYGLLVAWTYIRRPQWFKQMASWGFTPGIVTMLVGYTVMVNLDRWYMFGIFMGHTFLTLGSAMLIPAVENFTTLGWKALDRFVAWGALISYSVYLYHIMIVNFVKRMTGPTLDAGDLWWRVVIYLIITGVVSWLSFRYVEEPVLRWRDRRYPEIGR